MLSNGYRLGSYEIVSVLGAGGMGEVYRARDTRLKREVALKILPESFAADPDRLARFHREAEVLASLNHPHIAAIYGIEDANGTHALIMELVEGETLADRIARGPIRLDEALPIAKQIAEALEAAHEQGIIHRDLKPANIKVRSDGTVKVLDFGLAKLAETSTPATTRQSPLTISPTITSPALVSGVGVLLGTAAYMSPEQARGGVADRRSDLWAFGVGLFEMLTGTRLFEGATISDTLAAVLKTEPNWAALPAATPLAIRRLLRRCLEKDRKRRLESAADARLDVEDAIAAPPGDAAGLGVPVVTKRPSLWHRAMVPAAALLLGGAIVGGTMWPRASGTPSAPVTAARLMLSLPTGAELDDGRSVAISPDGRMVAFVARRSGVSQIYIRPIDRLEAREIPDTRGANAPFFSPDGQWLGFFASGKLKKASTTGGVVVTLADAAGGANANAAWSPNNTIAFTSGPSGLAIVSADGGEARPLLSKEQNAMIAVRSVDVLPGAEALLVATTARGARTVDEASIGVLTIKTGQLKNLVRGSTHAQYLPTGHLVYLRNGALMAAPLDLARQDLAGQPVEVMSGLRQQLYNRSRPFVRPARRREFRLRRRPRRCRPQPLSPRTRGSGRSCRVALDIRDQDRDIWIWTFATKTLMRLTFDPAQDSFPVWTRDSRRIVFLSGRNGISGLYWQAADGTGSASLLMKSSVVHVATSSSPDGKLLLVNQLTSQPNLLILPISASVGSSAPTTPQPLVETSAGEVNDEISPDGRWLAYQSNDTGHDEIYVRPFPNVNGGRWQVSTTGGRTPVWSHRGDELFFKSADAAIMSVQVETGPAWRAGKPIQLARPGFFAAIPVLPRQFEVSPDGRRFLVIKDANVGARQTPNQIGVVQNWEEELKQLLPAK